MTDVDTGAFFEEMTGEPRKKQKFMMLFEQKLYDSDDIPIGYGKLYVESDLCRLRGNSRV